MTTYSAVVTTGIYCRPVIEGVLDTGTETALGARLAVSPRHLLIAAAGAPVIATTSAGLSWSLGRQDGQRLSRPEAADAVRRIADAVDVPVTADIEGGYGSDPGAVAATVAAMIGAGADSFSDINGRFRAR